MHIVQQSRRQSEISLTKLVVKSTDVYGMMMMAMEVKCYG